MVTNTADYPNIYPPMLCLHPPVQLVAKVVDVPSAVVLATGMALEIPSLAGLALHTRLIAASVPGTSIPFIEVIDVQKASRASSQPKGLDGFKAKNELLPGAPVSLALHIGALLLLAAEPVAQTPGGVQWISKWTPKHGHLNIVLHIHKLCLY